MSRRTVLIVVYVALWTLLGIDNAVTTYMDWRRIGRDIAFWRPLTTELSSHYMHAALAPLVWTFARRRRLDDAGWRAHVPAHLLAIVAYSLAHTASMVAIRKAVYAAAGYRYVFGSLAREVPYELLKDAWTYALIVVVAYSFDYYRKAAALQARLAEAQLAQLETQLHPHFLYNALNTISSVMYTDVKAADRMLSHLGDLLRDTLARGAGQLVPLAHEEEFLRKYLDVMRMRFGDRLTVDLDFADDTREALVPRLVLQPLVENAIQHAVATRVDGGRIDVRTLRRNGHVEMTVRDNGPGVGVRQPAPPNGVGLRNTSRRLQHLYGGDHRLEVGTAEGGGALVTVVVPFRPAEAIAR